MQTKNSWSWDAKARLQIWRFIFPYLLLASFTVVAFAPNAHAANSSTPDSAMSAWRFSISPYLWAAGIEGKVGTLPGLPSADIDQSFGDILEDLDFAGMIGFNASKDRFSIAGDLQYVVTSAKDDSLSPLFNGEKLTSKAFVFSALGEYLVFQEGGVNLRLSGGIRLWSVDTKLKLSSGLLPGRSIKGDDTWVDPVIGMRIRADILSNLFLTGWGYVGGFGAGSDIMADLFGGVGYRFTNWVSTTFGYRWMKVDRDHDDFLYDVVQQGFMAGVTFQF